MNITKETKIGALGITAIICLIYGISFLKGVSLFSSDRVIYAYYNSVDGLIPSNQVLINGLQVGRVKSLELQSNRTIKATFIITNDIVIPDDSYAEIKSVSLMGGKAVDLNLGQSLKYIENGSNIRGTTEVSISDSLDPLKNKIGKILDRADSILASVNSIMTPEFQKSITHSVKNIEKSMRSFEVASHNLAQGSGRFDVILKNVESITENLKNNNDEISYILKNIQNVTDQVVRANIEQTLLNAGETVKNINEIMEKINNGQGTVGLLINDDKLYNNLLKTTIDLDMLLLEIKENPKKYINIGVF